MTILNNAVIILNGTSSSGKSSIAKELQEKFGIPVIHAQIDNFLNIFNFEAFKTGSECLEAVNVGFGLFSQSVADMCRTQYPIIIDTVFERAEYFQSTMGAIQNRKIYLIGIHCSVSELEIREKHRGDRRIGLAAEQFNIVHENMTYDLEVDTSTQTAEECASKIKAFVSQTMS